LATENHRVISALGEDRPGIVNELSRLIYDSQCNIVDSRMTVLGGEFAVILLVSGPPAAMAALQKALPKLQDQLGLTLISRATATRPPRPDQVP